MLSDGQGTIRTVIVYLPALDAKFARDVKNASGVVFVGRAGVETRAELSSHGALLTDGDVVAAAISARAELAARARWDALPIRSRPSKRF